jgi:preprotein translocase subunit SecE
MSNDKYNDDDRDELDRDDDLGESDDLSEDSSSSDEEVARREAAELEREERALADGGEYDVAPISGMLGVERWVQFAFIAIALTAFYAFDHLIAFTWGFFAEPDPTIVSGTSALIGMVGAFALYRHPRVYEMAHEVVSELSKVTWPTRDETYYSTVVVIVTSVIAALYTGIFDAVWSAFTDLVYKV